VEADPVCPLLENASKCGRLNSTLKFITIEGEPSKATNDEAIRKIIRTNARHSGQKEKGAPADHSIQPIAPAPVIVSGLPSKIPGRTRFALSSRKPMKRVRRRAVVGPPANESTDVSCQVIPRSLPFREVSSNWGPPNTKLNIGRMLQHRRQSHRKQGSDK
jgi:hypothetical protein